MFKINTTCHNECKTMMCSVVLFSLQDIRTYPC